MIVMPLLRLGLLLIAALFSSFILMSCASSEPFVKERDSTAVWTRHVTSIGSKDVTFELPPGGVLNPEPNTRQLRFGYGSLGGVTYGQLPQGKELAALSVSIVLRRYPKHVLLPSIDYEKFAAWADGEVHDFLVLRRSNSIIINGSTWHYQLLKEKDNDLVWGENYMIHFDENLYLVVSSLLWNSYARVDSNVSRAQDILKRFVQSVQVKSK
jgi:hypothetical protein